MHLHVVRRMDPDTRMKILFSNARTSPEPTDIFLSFEVRTTSHLFGPRGNGDIIGQNCGFPQFRNWQIKLWGILDNV
jgi:hypothetical protein